MLDTRLFAGAILILVSFSSTTHAQDILSSTGKTVRSYNYVEGFYLLNVEDDLPENSEIDLPVLFRLSFNVLDKLAIVGEYINQSYELNANGQSIDADIIVYELNLRYRGELRNMQNTDWIGGVSYGSIDLEISNDFERINGTGNYYGIYVGGRRTLTDRLEFEVGLDYTRLQEGGSFSGTGEAALVYRLANRLDVALGGTSLTDGNNYGVGLRYTWK